MQVYPKTASARTPEETFVLDNFDPGVIANMTVGPVPRLDSRYGKAAVQWERLGFAVVPGRAGGEKSPACKFALYCPGDDDIHVRGIRPDDITHHEAEAAPDANPLIILDSGTQGVRFVVIDVDEPGVEAWVKEQYGNTPLSVSTGREGGGVHLYYRAPEGVHVPQANGVIGPDESFDPETGRTPIDINGKRSYVVAPGAVHKSGVEYLCSVDVDSLTTDWLLANVPEFDVTAYGRHRKESEARKAKHSGSVAPASSDEKQPHSGVQPVETPRPANVTGIDDLPDEPFVQWCVKFPSKVNLKTWWGLAMNLAAAYGDGGAALFHAISKLDASKYTEKEATATWNKALSKVTSEQTGPTTYEKLVSEGYDGTVPSDAKAPAVVLRRLGGVQFPITHESGRWKGQPVQDRLENTEALLKHGGITVRYNEMSKQVEVRTRLGIVLTGNEADAVVLERGRRHGYRPARDVWDQHLRLLLRRNSYHPVRTWVESKPWDGTDRLGDLFGTLTLQHGADVNFAEVLLRRWLISAVAALYEKDGVKAEGVLVLQGDQSIGKTSWVASLSPVGIKTGSFLDPTNTDNVKQNVSNWIVELGELDATFRRADIARLKAFISLTEDTLRLPYARREDTFPRMTAFAASVNDVEFLRDATGNRRYWTLPVTGCNFEHGIDMQQVWAQVRKLYEAGERWWLDAAENITLIGVNSNHTQDDPIDEVLRQCFEPDPNSWTSKPDIVSAVQEAWGGSWTQREARSLTAALRRLETNSGVQRKKVKGVFQWALRRNVPEQDAIADITALTEELLD